ncbi:MAG: 3-methyl-2-oxobutanoate hydroxymethyltransferase [Epsilonproteobacteria bacterium]|nr:3-methyl-2-oxobutanoate hydroxymethyltransferase [Campylobacterota bacterium]OIO16122.1 MAG: 3-methyl-2-oxobutanoate hydroxymethyltransferase [Helicobacteraceae bacterium CG1_02_36_14]PIP10165.1 MAG: 3-methyl-2-oxobutanoate hydroxymethyltransferase [Sulfurimonas sp. CG23_combo_of_CG06-09_8_20_14_all_36_33]PIS26515.1 MAG: 3-methyl-2-oxobutanoate hydroxymethyltransferase [Sulfurimonas sp. CG08_land_8_20_14_0_20_36_33]PIU33977.1 MAG: 3-methyl-2-oxobutanoate hydroxymethyltransferase [Sulfurimona
MNKKMSISSIKKTKNVRPLVMITAYDALFARLFQESADIILVGDSLNMSFAGRSDTLSATMDQMLYHVNAVCRGAQNSFVICDMPFGTYADKETALKNSIRVFQESPADCVKIEGGEDKAEIIKHLTSNGIAVCGHIGLLPQSVRSEGGYKVKGRTQEEQLQLIKDARAVEEAGAFCMVIEGVVAEVASEVANSVAIPVVGIGAGANVDGQVLVFSDMLGLFEEFTPKFVKKYLDGATLVREALKSYSDEVQSREFPQEIHTY